jgi:hypothetical protein
LETEKRAGGPADLAADERREGLEMKGVIAALAAWLVPGAGHVVAGRWRRGLLLGAALVGAFLLGLYFHGRLATVDSANLLSLVFVFADAGSGLLYQTALLSGVGLDASAQTPTFEYGTSMLHVAGLLNYLVALDAYDVAVGRKR